MPSGSRRRPAAVLVAAVAVLAPAVAPSELPIGVAMPLDAQKVDLTYALLLGVDHFNARNDSLVRELGGSALAACDVRLRVAAVADTQNSALAATRAIFRLADAGVAAVLGSVRSQPTGAMATYGALLPLVQLSPVASSPVLDDVARYPYLRRMMPSDSSLARAILAHIRRYGWSEVGLVHVGDAYGDGLAAALADAAAVGNVALTSARFDAEEGLDGAPADSMRAAMAGMLSLDGEPLRVLIVGAFGRHMHALARAAADAGVAGPDGHVVVTNALTVGWLMEAEADAPLLRLLDGAARIEPSANADGRFAAFVATWRAAPREALGGALPPSARANRSVSAQDDLLAFAYDAGVALGVAACSTATPASPPALLAALSALEYDGLTGRVAFDPDTGGRRAEAVPYDLGNVVAEAGGEGDALLRLRQAGTYVNGVPQASATSTDPPPPFTFAAGRTQPAEEGARGTLLRVGFLGRWAGESASDTTSRSAMMAAQLAAMHFNGRNGTYVPAFAAAAPAGCDVRIELGLGHTRASPIVGLEAYLEGRRRGWGALVGASRSAVSEAVAQLAAIDGMPQVSHRSTSPTLSNADDLPTFARTIPSDEAAAYALALWLRASGARRAGVAFMSNVYGQGYAEALSVHCADLGIALVRAPFEPSDAAGLDAAMARLAAADVRFVVAVVSASALRPLLHAALAHGLAGGAAAGTHHWVFSGALRASQLIALADEPELARAVAGAANVRALGGVPGSARWESFARGWASGGFDTPELRQLVPAEAALEPDFFEAWPLEAIDAFAYDAVATVALAACNASRAADGRVDFGGGRWWGRLLAEGGFDGLTGTVALDEKGDRARGASAFELLNLRLVSAPAAPVPALAAPRVGTFSGGAWALAQPFLYADGGALPPHDGSAEEAGEAGEGGRGGGGEDESDGASDDAERSRREAELEQLTRQLMTLIIVAACLVGVLLCACGLHRAWARVKKVLRSQEVLRRQQDERIIEATRFINRLRFPAALVRLEALRAHGRLLSHEEARDRGDLLFIDTAQHLADFSERKSVVFVSHQWLGDAEPDPDGVHYPAVLRALHALCVREDLHPNELHVWMDYFSIPQANDALKLGSISSLATYASAARYFVVVAPPCAHHDSGARCDVQSYARRGWCRLEQWAHLATAGTARMFLADGGEQPLVVLSDEQQDWWHDAIHVFDGDFSHVSDKPLLVDMVVGLWALALHNALSPSGQRVQGLVRADREGVFPAELFGSMIERLEELEARRRAVHKQRGRASGASEAGGDEPRVTSTGVRGGKLMGGVRARLTRSSGHRRGTQRSGSPPSEQGQKRPSLAEQFERTLVTMRRAEGDDGAGRGLGFSLGLPELLARRGGARARIGPEAGDSSSGRSHRSRRWQPRTPGPASASPRARADGAHEPADAATVGGRSFGHGVGQSVLGLLGGSGSLKRAPPSPAPRALTPSAASRAQQGAAETPQPA